MNIIIKENLSKGWGGWAGQAHVPWVAERWYSKKGGHVQGIQWAKCLKFLVKIVTENWHNIPFSTSSSSFFIGQWSKLQREQVRAGSGSGPHEGISLHSLSLLTHFPPFSSCLLLHSASALFLPLFLTPISRAFPFFIFTRDNLSLASCELISILI